MHWCALCGQRQSFTLVFLHTESMLENSHWNYAYFDMKYASIYCEMKFIGFFERLML